ncbi:MAG: orotidine-5'-phosphate decarboxylase [Cyclobacteriaceae bacterium]|nr:orotidine-5'-phosphate decarboxylase [Cyclobacteriaceae bacterium]
MTYQDLFARIKKKRSFLCIGLDTDLQKIPGHLRGMEDPVFEFNKRIIDATRDLCIAYKPNLAFYEALGPAGLASLKKTIDYIPDDIFTIADAKRGDIGNTSELYAKAYFEMYSFDAITVNPYMGDDSVKPFLNFKDKWVILLALTSSSGSRDFQLLKAPDAELYKMVIMRSKLWAGPERLMYVVGATQSKHLKAIRELAPDHFLLIPGVGAQGGSLEEVVKYGMNKSVGLIVNSSRSILYASSHENFDSAARQKSMEIREEMEKLMDKYI